MILLKDIHTDELFELIDVYVAAKPYNSGYVKIVPHPNKYELDPYVESSLRFIAVHAAPMNGDFCREHDVDRITLSLAGIDFGREHKCLQY